MKETAVIALILISLMTLGVVCVQPIKAQYQGDITINADGSISPSTAPIQQNGDMYILTGDLIGSISVRRSNVALDGDGHTVQAEVAGVSLKNIENVTVKNLIIKANQYGIYLSECSYITVFNNTITGTSFPFASVGLGGISIQGGHNDKIVGNRLENNFCGMYLVVEHSTISENNITSNLYGIELWDALNNTIYHNNFINNDGNVVTYAVRSSQLNMWDGGYPSGGNYWSDYSGADANGDGIGGSPYIIDSSNQDRYPLIKPWEPDVAPPHISISSPENKTYDDSNVTLTFSTSEPTSKISYSLDRQDNVTATGNITLNEVPNGSHNLTVYATDEFGNTGASEIVYFRVEVPEPFPTTLVAVASGASVAVLVVAAGLLVYFKKRNR